MTEKTPEKKRRGLTFPTDPLAVMQMDEIDAGVRRAESDLSDKSNQSPTATPVAPTPQTGDGSNMASHMAGNMAGITADKTGGSIASQQDSQPEGRTAGSVSTAPYGQTLLQTAAVELGEAPSQSPPPLPPIGSAKIATGTGVSQTERESRLTKAMQVIEENELVNITVRIPAKFNGFLDEYVDRLTRTNPKRRYKKQDAIAEALALFIADHPMPAMPATQDDF